MSDLTTKVLIEIRDEIRSTNSRLDQTNQRLDNVTECLGNVTERLDNVTERLDNVTDRLDNVTDRLDTHEKVLVRLVDLSERHEQTLGKLVTRMDTLNDRFDNFLTGAHQKARDETRRKYDELDQRVTRLERAKPRPRRAG